MAVDYPYLVMIVCEEEKRFAARDDFVEAGAAKPGVCPPSHFSSHFERPPCFLPHSIFSTLDTRHPRSLPLELLRRQSAPQHAAIHV